MHEPRCLDPSASFTETCIARRASLSCFRATVRDLDYNGGGRLRHCYIGREDDHVIEHMFSLGHFPGPQVWSHLGLSSV